MLPDACARCATRRFMDHDRPRATTRRPRTSGSLEQRLRNMVEDGNLQLRTRRQIGYMAVIAALAAHARDVEGKPLFVIRGGVAIELLMGLRARTTKDLDAAVRTVPEEIEPRLRDALAQAWDGSP